MRGRHQHDTWSGPVVLAAEHAWRGASVVSCVSPRRLCNVTAAAHLLAVAYPWTFYLDGNNAAVLDVELLGAWNGINATLAHRFRPAARRRAYP